MSPSKLIRVGLTDDEWVEIQRQADAQDVSAKKLVTDAIRERLLGQLRQARGERR